MKHLTFFILMIACGMPMMLIAQKRWDGGAGTNRWNNPLNWTNNSLPTATDDVIFDNSFVSSSYTVEMPSVHGTVRSITIQPSQGRNIEVYLPPANIDVPGFSVTGPGYGMNIYPGGVFRNSAGSGSGAAILVRDSIRILNEGRYIHNTTGGHVNAVEVLSRAAGTELGIFEISIPAASATISISDRVFGRLILRTGLGSGTTSYTAAGTSRCVIRSDFEIDSAVNVVLNYDDTIFVNRSFVQRGGRFNFGSLSRSAVLFVSGDFTQHAGAEIAEYGLASHSIVMGGNNSQMMAVNGFWFNDVAFVKSGRGTVLLRSSLRLSYQFHLLSGFIGTSAQWPLILLTGCTMHVDSLAQNTGIAGPVTKEGLGNSSILFPVGSLLRMYWIRLEQATGSFTINYRRLNPRTISNTVGNGLHHISEIEYWDVTGSPASSAQVKLSFNDIYSGGVTDLTRLRVARLANGVWENAGSSAVGGSAGSSGWVRSNMESWVSTATRSFTLASTTATENPLPLFDPAFTATKMNDGLLFRWKINPGESQPLVFEIQHSFDGRTFNTIKVLPYIQGTLTYDYFHRSMPSHGYFKLRIVTSSHDVFYDTKAVRIVREVGFEVGPVTYRNGFMQFDLQSPVHDEYFAELFDAGGRRISISRFNAGAGRKRISFAGNLTSKGVYILRLRNKKKVVKAAIVNGK